MIVYMDKSSTNKAWMVRLLLAICITISIGLMYYVNIVRKDYEVFTNPDGPVMDDQ